MEEGMIATLLLAVLPAGAPAPKEDVLWDKLRARVAQADERLDGVLAVSIEDLASGRTIELRASEPFATASCIKAAVLLELYHQAATGRVDLQQAAPLPSPRVGGGGPLEMLGAGAQLTWRDMAALMISYSDNDAANAVIDRVGMEAVNARVQALGLATTRLRRRMLDTAAARAGRENVSTAAELRALLKAVRSGDGLPPPLADDMRAVAALPKRSEFEVALPEGVRAVAKSGFLDGVRCWAGVVDLPHRPFAMAVLAGHLGDDAAGEAAIRETVTAVLATFERLALDSEYGRTRMR
jgi:beta-lactamase class A